MDFSKFKEIEQQYRELKEKLRSGEINSEYMKKELKKMMVLDENGNYWMIGGKTGRWYIYEGTEWKESNPFQEKPNEPVKETYLDKTMGKAGAGTVPFKDPGTVGDSRVEKEEEEEEVAVEASGDRKKFAYEYEDEEPFSLDVTSGPLNFKTETPPGHDESESESESENPLDDEQDSTDHFTICKICKAKISVYSIYCPVCGANRKETAEPARKIDRTVIKDNELLLASVKISSLIFFMGGLGLIVGVFCGAAFGIFKTLIPEFQPLLPDMLAETRGGMAGGLIFAAIGGIAAFTLSAFSAAFLGIVYNIISFIFGGIRFKIKH